MPEYKGIEFDVVTEENLTLDNNVTQHPIEDGADVTDNVELEPTRIRVELTKVGPDAEETKEELKEERAGREPGDYFGVEQIEPYENMIISSLEIPTDSSIDNGFRATMTLQQIEIAEADEVTVDLGQDPVTGQQAQEDEGEADNREPEEEETDSSTLNDLVAGR